MNYSESICWINSLGRNRIEPGLDRSTELLSALEIKPAQIPGILIAGTNGKGSTCVMAAAVLTELGLRVGTMPSPHLVDVRERICVNGVQVTQDEFASAVSRVRSVVETSQWSSGEPTEFEAILAAACVHFVDRQVDVLVVEVGLGGRLDATNVLDLGVKVITTIGLDHEELLGSSIVSIAGEKAGIIRPHDHVVMGWLPDAAAEVVAQTADRMHGAGLDRGGVDFTVSGTARRARVELEAQRCCELDLPLLGRHQAQNLATAVTAVRRWCERQGRRPPKPGDWELALSRVRWPGRLEFHPDTVIGEWRGDLVLDGAHNLQAINVLVKAMTELVPEPPVVIFGACADKRVDEMLQMIPPSWPIVLTAIDNPRSAQPTNYAPGSIQRAIGWAASAPEALDRAAGVAARQKRPILATGSLFLIGELQRVLADEQD